MKIEEFNKEMNENLKELDIELSEKQLKQFYDYMNILIEWNKVMNLTNITEPSEIIQKHFIDSLTVLKHIKDWTSEYSLHRTQAERNRNVYRRHLYRFQPHSFVHFAR